MWRLTLPVYWESLVEFAREAGVEEGELRRGLFEPGAELREVRRALDVLAAFVERLVRGEVDDRLRVDIGYAPPASTPSPPTSSTSRTTWGLWASSTGSCTWRGAWAPRSAAGRAS